MSTASGVATAVGWQDELVVPQSFHQECRSNCKDAKLFDGAKFHTLRMHRQFDPLDTTLLTHKCFADTYCTLVRL